MSSGSDALNRTYDLEESMFADENKEPPSTSSSSSHALEKQVPISNAMESDVLKSPIASQIFAPPFPISSPPSGDMAKIRAKSPWSDHVAARKRLLGKLLSGPDSKRTIPPPFPVTPTLSHELRSMMGRSNMDTEKKQGTAYPSSTDNSTTTSVSRMPAPWGNYPRKEGFRGHQCLHTEHLKHLPNREDGRASCSD